MVVTGVRVGGVFIETLSPDSLYFVAFQRITSIAALPGKGLAGRRGERFKKNKWDEAALTTAGGL